MFSQGKRDEKLGQNQDKVKKERVERVNKESNSPRNLGFIKFYGFWVYGFTIKYSIQLNWK